MEESQPQNPEFRSSLDNFHPYINKGKRNYVYIYFLIFLQNLIKTIAFINLGIQAKL